MLTLMSHTLDIALARQPIFDRADQLVGYELLYRRGAEDTSAVSSTAAATRDPAQMTTDTIAGTFLGLGLDRVTGGKRAFVNVDRSMLLDGSIRVLDPDRVVLEILESVICDPETIAACEALVSQGYRLALDDFEYRPSYAPLLHLASIVKIDVLGKSPAELEETIGFVRPFRVRCLAERVETAEMRHSCAAMGFELFQGYYFARPVTLSGRQIPVEYTNIFRLLNLLRDADEPDSRVEDVFRHDVSLTHKLLRLVNSAGVGRTGVTSIGHGIRLIGRNALHRWMSLLLVSSMTRKSGVRDELLEMAMVRARFCELIMETVGRRRDRDASFVAGLFSLLDTLMDVSMPTLVGQLHLTPEIEQVLLRREGPYAPALRIAEAYESARWDDLFACADQVDLTVDEVPQLYLQSLEWARMSLGTAADGTADA
jgi:EAL and modified HD-GYP domain-containing signal transduction protein